MIRAIFGLLLGLIFGSFLNVCITRLPLGKSVITPRSHCRHCGSAIRNLDNIPLLSWIVLQGCCRICKAPISWRYPVVEAITSLLFCECLLKFGWGWAAAAWAALCFLLLGLAVMDAETLLLPDRFTLPGLLLGLLVAGARGVRAGTSGELAAGLRSAGAALLAALIAAAFLLLISGVYWLVRRRQGMGMGDVKLLAMLAAWLGLPRTALTFVLAVVIGAICGVLVLLLASRQGTDGERSASTLAIPFGAFLSLAGLYSVFLGERTLRWYLQFFR
jgi:leader peptidase (prepilin peptidase) / N-methyltransferase